MTRSVIAKRLDFSGCKDSKTIYCSMSDERTLLYSIGESKSGETATNCTLRFANLFELDSEISAIMAPEF